MTELPIGIQLYSVREDMEKDFEGTLKSIGEMGYDAVEFAGLFGHSAEEVKEYCKKANVVPISAHVGINLIKENIDKTMKTYSEIGCKAIVIPWMDKSFLPGGEHYNEFLEDIKIISSAAKKYGMYLCYHNHDFEFDKINGENKLDILYKDTDPDILKTQIDTCWAAVGGEDPAKFVKKYSGRAPLVHLKDYVGSKSANMYGLIDGGKSEEDKDLKNVPFELRPVGYGIQNINEIINASKEAGATCIIVEQDMPSMGKTPMECAKASIDFIRSL